MAELGSMQRESHTGFGEKLLAQLFMLLTRCCGGKNEDDGERKEGSRELLSCFREYLSHSKRQGNFDATFHQILVQFFIIHNPPDT